MTKQKQLIGMAAAAAFALVVVLAVGYSALQKSAARVDSSRALHDYLLEEKAALSTLKDKAALFEAKRRNSRGKDVHGALNEAVSSLGLNDKLTSLKSPPGAASAEDERAEARFDGLTLNELVNLQFALDNSRMLILTRKANIRVSFENPELLNVTLSVSLIKPQ